MKRILSLIGVVLVVGCGSPPDGPFEEYYDNGQLMEKGIWKDGERDGPYEGYWDNGQLKLKRTYKNGDLDGPFERYHDNGELVSRGTFKDNKSCGEWLSEGRTVTYDPC